MMHLFYFYDVYDGHNQSFNFRQKIHLFLDLYFCMDFLRGMVSEDILTTYFGSTWSRATNWNAETSTERACQSKWWHKRMETKRYFLNQIYHRRFASGYDQNQLIITDVNKQKQKKHQLVPKLMMFVPKWDKRNNQRKIDKSFYKLLDTNNRMTDSNAEINWKEPKARKMARNGKFRL